ncbi:cyclophilin-like fold protein [Lacrimispora brassicae]
MQKAKKNKRKLAFILLGLFMLFGATACTNENTGGSSEPPASSSGSGSPAPLDTSVSSEEPAPVDSSETTQSDTQPQESSPESAEIKLKITVGEQELTATLDNNTTTQALLEKLPMTVPMQDLYNREMCYRFPDELPTSDVQNTGYEVGDIIYWPPGRSFVIMYAQNGEQFSRQKIGRVDSGVEIFAETGDTDVTFAMLEE